MTSLFQTDVTNEGLRHVFASTEATNVNRAALKGKSAGSELESLLELDGSSPH